MDAALDSPVGTEAEVELPTLALLAFVYGSWLALTWYHEAIPLWLWLPWAIWISAWWGSAQHELLHGHPTAWPRVNRALGMAPFWLWLPYARYRQTHLAHHRDEMLTDPVDDPESRYVEPARWAAMGPVRRALVWTQTTLAGRVLLGPMLVIPRFLLDDWRLIRAGNKAVRNAWAGHVLLLAPLLFWVFGVCQVPVWLYALAFVHMGLGLAMIRSFAEHRAAEDVAHRTAIVENAGLFGLLFLNNNLHVAHHRWPRVAWYRLPAVYEAHRDELRAANGGLVYDGYGDVFRRYGFRPHDAPVHRMGRVPACRNLHAGTT